MRFRYFGTVFLTVCLIGIAGCASSAGDKASPSPSSSSASGYQAVIQTQEIYVGTPGGKAAVVRANECILVHPAASWIKRQPDVNRTPGGPGEIVYDYPKDHFREDANCSRPGAWLVLPTADAGPFTVTLRQDGRTQPVSITIDVATLTGSRSASP